jgi:hypothetical protein
MSQIVEIEIDNPRNGCLQFQPLGRSLRGKYHPMRDAEPNAKLLITDYPDGVPGQRLGLDQEAGTAYIADGLHDDTPSAGQVRDKLKAKGFSLPPAREDLSLSPGDVPTWQYWMRRAVEAGLAKVVKGKLPDTIKGKVRKSFITQERGPDPRDRQIERLTAILFSKLSATERAAVEKILSETE